MATLLLEASSLMRTLRVFLGSSRELADEREGFAAALAQLNGLPHISRNYHLVPVLWERDASGTSADINETIQATVEFQDLDFVVIAVWNKAGAGTADEYSRAALLQKAHGRPVLLVFVRTPSGIGTGEGQQSLLEFEKRVVDNGTVTTYYDTPQDFFEKLKEHLPKHLPLYAGRGDFDVSSLRRWYDRAMVISVLLSAAAIYLVQTTSYPTSRVSEDRVLAILALPILIFLAYCCGLIFLHRLLDRLRQVWHSPMWSDEGIYDAFRNLLPWFLLPDRLKQYFPKRRAAAVFPSVTLLAVLLVPCIGQYKCLFDEIFRWSIVDAEPANAAARAGFEAWFWPSAGPAVHVFLPNARRDCGVDPSAQGPEVFPLWQPVGYVTLFALSAFGTLFSLKRLAGYRHEFRVDVPASAQSNRRSVGAGTRL